MITLLLSYKHTSHQHHQKNQFISVLSDNELPPASCDNVTQHSQGKYKITYYKLR